MAVHGTFVWFFFFTEITFNSLDMFGDDMGIAISKKCIYLCA